MNFIIFRSIVLDKNRNLLDSSEANTRTVILCEIHYLISSNYAGFFAGDQSRRSGSIELFSNESSV